VYIICIRKTRPKLSSRLPVTRLLQRAVHHNP